ncbi:MAG: hypothetical protein Q4D38_03815 [Planctomycetia bacterium]|nr:hypothetical protein [Planctomycetia bacterium]
MLKYIPIALFLMVVGYVFSTCHFDVFMWKDTSNLERIVITSKAKDQQTDIPAYPPELGEDERLQHKNGVVGVTELGLKNAMKLIPKKEGEEEEEVAAGGMPPRTHSVGRQSIEHESLDIPVLTTDLKDAPESQTADGQPAVGSAAAVDHLTESLEAARSGDDPRPGRKVTFRRFHEEKDSVLFGSFNIDPWDDKDLKYPGLLEELLFVLAQFDLVAVQGVYTSSPRMLDELTSRLTEKTGRQFRHVAIFPQNQNMNDPVPAFIYDSTTMEVDRHAVFYVGYEGKPFVFRPLAAKFRVKKAPPEDAFTFIAVNMNLFPTYEANEIQYVPDVIRTAKETAAESSQKNAGIPQNKEDDVILMGHWGIDPDKVTIRKGFEKNLSWSVEGLPTNTWGKYQLTSENIAFLPNATCEFIDGGVWNLAELPKRTGGIPFDQHPVWGIFSIWEGGKK